MSVKTITLQTNFNKKMLCPFFIHLTFAPPPVAENVLESTIVTIATQDGSHPPIQTKCINLIRIPLKDIHEILTRLSHGMSRIEFVKFLEKEHSVNPESEMAIYYYSRQ